MDKRKQNHSDEIIRLFLAQIPKRNQAEAARRLGTDRRRINDYYNHRCDPPEKLLIQMEQFLAGRGIFLSQTQGNQSPGDRSKLSHSRRANQVISDSEWGKKRTGRRGKKNNELIRHNSDELKKNNRTDTKLAKKYGFKSRFMLHQAVKVITWGCRAVIQAMDDESISFCLAANLSTLPDEQQLALLAQGKKKAIAYFKQKKIAKKESAKKQARFDGLKAIWKNKRLIQAEKKTQLPLRKTVMGLGIVCNQNSEFPWDLKKLQKNSLLAEVPLSDCLNELSHIYFVETAGTTKKIVGRLLF